jgi:hypothetical protein
MGTNEKNLVPQPEPEQKSGRSVSPSPAGAADPRRTPGPAWGAPALVWSVWALMVLGGLVYVFRYASQVPYMDDWNWVPILTGEQPVTATWLWEQVDDHRAPLSKLLILAVYKVAGGDIRSGMVANVLSFGALAFAMIWVAKRLRGRTSYLDVFFPLALLNFDQEIIFMGLGVTEVPSTVAAGLLLLLIAARGAQLTFRAALAAGIGVVLLALIGMTGLVLVPALALWLGYVGWWYWRSPEPGNRRKGLLVWGLAAIALFMVPLYFVGYHQDPGSPPSAGWRASLRTALQIFSSSFGHAVGYPFPGHSEHPVPPILGVGVVLLALVSTGILGWVWLRQPRERPRALGLFCFLGAMASLALGIGMARSGWGEDAGYTPRYVPLVVPVLCCLYLIWEVYGAPVSRRVVQACLVVPLVLLLPLNARKLLDYGEEHARQMAAVERDARAGVPASALAENHGRFLNDQYDQEKIARYVRMLCRAQVGPFRPVSDDSAAVDPAKAEAERKGQREEEELAARIREVAAAELPADATVLVISSKDDNLLRLGGRRQGWHFPRIKGGTAHGYYPADSAEAIARLEELRDDGAQFLLVPEPAFWWLDDKDGYKEFRQHLEKRYRVVVRREDTCVIFDLRR